MFSLIAWLLLAVQGLVVAGYVYLTWHHSYWKKRGLVTAEPLGLLGSYPGVLTGSRNLILEVQDIYDKYKGKYRAVGVFLTRVPQILVLDPQLAHEVLVKNFNDYRDTISSDFVGHAPDDKYVARNPFFSKGDDWKRRRTDAGAGLTASKLRQAYAIWEQSGEQLMQYVARHIEQHGHVIETRDLCYRYMAHTMADFIWGIDAGSLAGSVGEPSQFQAVASKWATRAFQNFGLFNKTLMAPFTRKLLQLRFFGKDTDAFFLQLTQDAVKMRQQTANAAARTDYLAHLLQLLQQKGATHDDLVGHALTLLMDGYETSTAVLFHMLYTLSENPAVQQKLREEIRLALDVDQRILSYEQLTTLPYLEQCVNESLRMTSVIGTLTKICTKATTIDLGHGKVLQVEPGISIMVPAYQFHHDETYFPEPFVYKPERFENDAQNEFTKHGYFLPFGDGPRICLGMRLGLLNVKMAVARLLVDYELIQTAKVPMNSDSGLGIYLDGDINLKYNKLSK